MALDLDTIPTCCSLQITGETNYARGDEIRASGNDNNLLAAEGTAKRLWHDVYTRCYGVSNLIDATRGIPVVCRVCRGGYR